MRPSLFRHCGTHCHGPCKAPPRVSQPWTARVAASNETGVVEVKAHGPAAGLHGVISQVHGQADEVAFDENAVISVADGPETVIRRRDVLSRDCRKLPTIPQILDGISQ